MKVVHYATTPVAGAPFQQVQCLKKYSNVEVRLVNQRIQYKDGRVFPKDLLIAEQEAREAVRNADVVHLHNYLASEVKPLLNRTRQKIIATLHSIPRQGNWQDLMTFAHKTYCIRQPMQLREYKGFDSLPNLFDVWDYLPPADKDYNGVIKIVYCPTNTYGPPGPGSKGYPVVMPFFEKIKKEYGSQIELIHHRNVEYHKNLRLKSEGHITIDDICGSTFHLTSLEACCTAQAVLTSVPKEWGFPFVYTTLSNYEEKIRYLLENRDKLRSIAQASRRWIEQNWNPQIQVQEYIRAYGG